MRLFLLPALLAFMVAGCNQTASTPQDATPTATASGAGPAGDGCSADIGRFQEIIDNDVSIGRLARTVYGRAKEDVKQAEIACAAGRAVQARSILASAKKTYGYN